MEGEPPVSGATMLAEAVAKCPAVLPALGSLASELRAALADEDVLRTEEMHLADAEMHFVLGIAAEARGSDEYDAALDEYDAAVMLDPQCWRALFHTGKIALSFGWITDAVDYFRQVAEINPDHAPTQALLDKLDELEIDVDELEEAAAPPDEGPPTIELPDGMGDNPIEL